MTAKELKRLRRADLLEMLIAQGKQMEKLEKELAEAKEELKNREITINEAGNIAEASLRLNRIFEVAQEAADQFLENLYSHGENLTFNEPAAQGQNSMTGDSTQNSLAGDSAQNSLAGNPMQNSLVNEVVQNSMALEGGTSYYEKEHGLSPASGLTPSELPYSEPAEKAVPDAEAAGAETDALTPGDPLQSAKQLGAPASGPISSRSRKTAAGTGLKAAPSLRKDEEEA